MTAAEDQLVLLTSNNLLYGVQTYREHLHVKSNTARPIKEGELSDKTASVSALWTVVNNRNWGGGPVGRGRCWCPKQ